MSKSKNNISYKAAIYLRLSKEDEDFSVNKVESNSIANQKAFILKELESMPNVSLYNIYVDDGYTGLNFERPNFKRMENDILQKKVNMVVVKDLSRLGRDYIEVGRYVQKFFPMLNVRFVSILDRFDSLVATSNDVNLLIPIKNFVNDSYSRDISEKIRSHQEIMRINGLYVGSYVPYGYKKMEQNKNKIIPDEYAADIVKHIYQWKLDGISVIAIANKLNRLGVLAPSEYKKSVGINYQTGFQTKIKVKWSDVAVRRILTNKIYIGILQQGKRKKVNYKVNKLVEKPENEWHSIEGKHPAIISKTDFDNVQKMLLVDTRVCPNEERISLFSGILYCGECNRCMARRITRYKGKKKIYYICSTYNKKGSCSRHSIKENILLEILLVTINNHINTLVEMNKILEVIKNLEIDYQDIIANDTEVLAKYEELQNCKKMSLSLHKDLAEETISFDEYERFQKMYEERYKEIQDSIKTINQEIKTIFKNGLLSTEWISKFKKYKSLTTINRAVLTLFVEKIIIYEDKRIDIVFKYQDEYQLLYKIADNTVANLPVIKEVCKHG